MKWTFGPGHYAGLFEIADRACKQLHKKQIIDAPVDDNSDSFEICYKLTEGGRNRTKFQDVIM